MIEFLFFERRLLAFVKYKFGENSFNFGFPQASTENLTLFCLIIKTLNYV